LGEPLAVQGASKATIEARLRELLGEVGLAVDVLDRYPHEFSGGQRQRLGFARALAVEPRLVIADEPVSALDVSIQAQILNMMQDLREQHSLSYLFISHDLAVVRYIADRIGVMYLGKLVEVGPSAEVFSAPAHPYTRGLLSSVPTPDVDAPLRSEFRITGEIPSPVDPPSGCRFRTRCPAADDLCAAVEPVMEAVEVDGADHQVACHHPLRTTVALRPTVSA
jgi:peptide/nickel transport system ATP-binding protein